MLRHQQPRRDTVSNSPMHQAAFSDDLRQLREILAIPDNHKNINLKNHLGCTPLRLAATAGNQASIELLTALGADVNVTDIKGQTPLFVAAKNNHPRCVQLLARYGADPDGSANCLSSPLYIAAMHGLTQCVQVLIRAGADVNCCLTRGPHIDIPSTPLHISFTYRHLQCFTALLLGGADPNCGQTVKQLEAHPSLLDAAIAWGDTCFVKPLVEFGGTMTKKPGHWQSQIAYRDMTEKKRELHAYLSKNVPQSLQSLCRITVRRSLGGKRLASVSSLPLPSYMRKYLLHSL